MSRASRQMFGATALLLLATGVSPAAGDHQSLSAIATAVGEFVRADRLNDRYPPKIQVGRLDSRLRLRRCDQPLQVQYANAQRTLGQTYASVRCAAPVEWRIYVPVAIAAFGDVLVTQRPLPREHRLSADDVRMEKHDLSRLRQGFYSEIRSLKQLQTRRAIDAGAVLTPDKVAPVKLVRSGEMVHLESASGHVRVAARGKALSDGAAGHTVRVRNMSSGRVVEGRVIGPGRVSVQ